MCSLIHLFLGEKKLFSFKKLVFIRRIIETIKTKGTIKLHNAIKLTATLGIIQQMVLM